MADTKEYTVTLKQTVKVTVMADDVEEAIEKATAEAAVGAFTPNSWGAKVKE